MKAISLWQPWATLWLLSDPDEKVFETRGWYTHHRGQLLVHAAKKRDGEVRAALAEPYFRERLAAHGLKPEDLSYGALIGEVDLISCAHMDLMVYVSTRERNFGDWSPERFAWARGPSPELFRRPIPYVGHQGFFDVSESRDELKLKAVEIQQPGLFGGDAV